MNEKAEQAIAKILKQAAEGIDNAAMFGQQHLPDVVQQLLTWHLVHSLILFGAGLALIVLAAVGIRCAEAYKQRALQDYKDGEAWTRFRPGSELTSTEFDMVAGHCFHFLACLPAVVGLIMLFANLEWLQILVAPKLYVLEYAASLVA